MANLEELFNQYWKTELVRAALREKAKELDQMHRRMMTDLQTAWDEYRKLLDESANQALSPAESTKYQPEAEDQLEHTKESEHNLATFEQQADAPWRNNGIGREDLLSDIRAAGWPRHFPSFSRETRES